MIASAQTLRELGTKLITPFTERTESHGLTFGVGPGGYDVRVEFDRVGSIPSMLIKANGKLHLASTIEYFYMPNYLEGVVHDKSTWARRGLFVQNTVIEAGWDGFLTIELTNQSDDDIMLLRGMPIAQVLFHFLDQATDIPYRGKYNAQERGPQEAR